MPLDDAPAPESLDLGLRESLAAGFAAADTPASVAAPVAEIKPATIPDPTAKPAEAAAPVRDESGRFAPKADKPTEAAVPEAQAKPEGEKPTEPKTTDKPATTGQEAPSEPIPPPAALSAVAKAKWSKLPPEMQAEWAKRETDMVQGMQKQADQLKRYARIEEVIAPHRDRLALAQVEEGTYLKSLIAADEMLRGPNSLQAWVQIGQMYGIDPRQLAQPGQQPPQAAQRDPAVQAMAQELSSLKNQLAQFQGAAQQTEQSRLQAQIDGFAKDHMYFEDVKPQMAALLRTPALASLADTDPVGAMKKAYDQACRASDDVWPLLQAEQTQKAEEAARAAAAAKASEARQASGSITGSPAAGAMPARAEPPADIRDALRQAFSDAA